MKKNKNKKIKEIKIKNRKATCIIYDDDEQ